MTGNSWEGLLCPLASQDEADILQSLHTNCDRHGVRRKKKFSGVFGHWDLGVVTPPWSCISWLLLTFISIVPYDLTPTDLSELFPHLFFPFPFCSATLAVPEYISFISNLGFCTVQKRFMATSLHDPLLHPHLYSTVSFLERMSLTMCLKYCPLLPSLFIPF